ncbi:hypothetical protein CPJCM30710_24170 [Clostridium polyendosporum]|uniref:Uncharacterized protein n=1 Tax=Clostridium polyendosporum TaxID=69208 RepID=A0A919S0L1_9CLOT|nr:ground-like protein [Clostridium polyendosporum]GIM29751.1 hypothetical protein CPJCM30710_24170 [Clostridium polyendosporum]
MSKRRKCCCQSSCCDCCGNNYGGYGFIPYGIGSGFNPFGGFGGFGGSGLNNPLWLLLLFAAINNK